MDDETRAEAERRIDAYLDVDPTPPALGALIWHFLNRGVPEGTLRAVYDAVVAQRLHHQPDARIAPAWPDIVAAKPRTGVRLSQLRRLQGDRRLYGGKPAIFVGPPLRPKAPEPPRKEPAL